MTIHELVNHFPNRASLSALLLAATVLTTLPHAGAAGVYKWTDENGKVHFTDKPPPDVKAETIKTRTYQNDDAQKRLDDLKSRADEGVKKRQEAKAAEAEDKTKKAALAARCESARQKLEQLQNSTRRQVINEKGEREFLVEDKRQEWIKAAREEIADAC